jgi:hypothetical protein
MVTHQALSGATDEEFLQRMEDMQEERAVSLRRGFRLFPVHNKYTPEDWQWLLAEAGLTIRYQTQLRPAHQIST